MKFVKLLAIAPVLIGAAEPVRLQPVSTWQLDYADESCRLGRQFGDPQNPRTLLSEQASPGYSMSMVVISPSLGELNDFQSLTARFLPVEKLVFSGGIGSRTVKTDVPAATWSGVGFNPPPFADPSKPTKAEISALREKAQAPRDLQLQAADRAEMLANAAKVTSIQLAPRPKRLVILETGSLGKPVAMLGDCTRDLVKSWGLDPDVQEKIVRAEKPKTPVSSWFTTADYPSEALSRGERAVVKARVLVDATGKITKCTSLSHFDAPAFQKTVCDVVLKRGGYQPAELGDGTKVATYSTVTIRFQMAGM